MGSLFLLRQPILLFGGSDSQDVPSQVELNYVSVTFPTALVHYTKRNGSPSLESALPEALWGYKHFAK